MSRGTEPMRALVGLTVVALLAGCAGGATFAPSSTTPAPATTAPVATATPRPTTTQTPSAATTVTPVAGTGTCPTADLGSPTTGADGVTHYRGGTFICDVTTDDPRVSGTETAAWNMDLWGTLEDGAVVVWGTSRLENSGGAWEGTGSGVGSSDRRDIIAFWYKGTGGYAGLGYFALWTGWDPWTIRGQIFPGDPPNVAGLSTVTGPDPTPNLPTSPPMPASTPAAIAYGPVAVVRGTHVYTVVDIGGGTYAGIDTVNDPRVSGTFLSPSWTLNFWGTTSDDLGSGTQWGPTRLKNAGGEWQGVASGIYDDGGDVIAIWYTGTGGYAGLSYFELWTGTDPWTIRGQIFPGDPPTP